MQKEKLVKCEICSHLSEQKFVIYVLILLEIKNLICVVEDYKAYLCLKNGKIQWRLSRLKWFNISNRWNKSRKFEFGFFSTKDAKMETK